MLLCWIVLISFQIPQVGSTTVPGRQDEVLLEEAFYKISQKFEVFFNYDRSIASDITVEYNEDRYSSLEEALSNVLRNTNLKYHLFDEKYVVVFQNDVAGLKSLKKMIEHFQGIVNEGEFAKARKTKVLTPLNTFSTQELYNKRLVVNISGTVTDQSGEPLIGVNVLVKGSNKGTSTDFNGEFSIPDVDVNAVLVFSYIGYQTTEIPVNGQTNLSVTLLEDLQTLDEVVVVGYGKQTKREVTGAISSISSEDLGEVPSDGFVRSLAGKISGVQIQQSTGSPGGNMNIRVRGTGSINAGNDPLYVIDGFPIEQTNISGADQGVNPLSAINPDDILSIEVLKDAAAASIYGSRAATGVVIITTKQGESGKAKINFSTSIGTQSVINKMDLLNGDEFIDLVKDAYQNAANTNEPGSLPPEFLANESQYLGVNTDWQDEIFRSASVANYQLSASGGNEKMNYYVSGGYMNEEGIVRSSGFERYSLRVNLNADLTDKIRLGMNLTPTLSKYDEVKAEGHWAGGGVVNIALIQYPFLGIDSDQESFVQNDATLRCCDVTNPLFHINDYDGNSSQFRTLGNGFVEIDLLDDLTFKSSIGTDVLTYSRNVFTPDRINRGNENDIATSNAFLQTSWLNENTLNYSRKFNDHTISLLGGFSYQSFKEERRNLEAFGFSNETVTSINSSSNTISNAVNSIEEWALVSLIGRVNYSIKNKYFLTGTIRRDGSSRFGANNRYGTFPSISAGWSLVEEDFMKPQSSVSELKLRASFGVSGNNRIGNYASIGLLNPNTYVFGQGTGSSVSGFSPSTIANPDLTWETTKQFNFGVDYGMYNDRVFITADAYSSKTENLLLNVPIPTISGFNTALQNLGSVKNTGLELMLSGRVFDKSNFSWSSSFNISFNKNEVLKLGAEGDPLISGGARGGTHISEIGGELGAFYMLEQIGIFQNEEEIENSAIWDITRGTWPGDVKYRDANNDGVINADDRVVVGSPFPDFVWGWTNSFSYKNFDLNIVLNGVQGNNVLNINRRFIENLEGNQNQLAHTVNRWKSPSEPGNGKTPRANATTSGNNNQPSTRWLEDASFTRIQNVTLGYSFDNTLMNQIGVNNFRLFLAVNNLAYFTDYLGYNPEVSFEGGSALNPGEDYGAYPLARRFTIGLKLGL